MRRFLTICGWLSKGGVILSAISMILVVLLIMTEIILRSVFNTSTLVADEYSGYLMLFIVMFGLAHTMKTEGHIRITLITGRLKETSFKVLDAIVSGVACVVTCFCFYHAVKMVYDTYSLGMKADSIAETPLFLPQIAVPVGFGLLALDLLARCIENIMSLTDRK